MIWIIAGVLAAAGLVAMFLLPQRERERDALGQSLDRERERGW